jgi:hypothetical protein
LRNELSLHAVKAKPAALPRSRSFVVSLLAIPFFAVAGVAEGAAIDVLGSPPPASDAAWDGALGFVVNAIDWAAAGTGLDIVSFYDGDFPGSLWWLDDDSFLRDELLGSIIGRFADNTPFLSPALAALPVNAGLTTQGLSNWTNSFHGNFSLSTPGYAPTVLDDELNPMAALTIFRDTALVPLPGAFWMFTGSVFALWALLKTQIPLRAGR